MPNSALRPAAAVDRCGRGTRVHEADGRQWDTLCTLPNGHTGDHMALVHRWPNETAKRPDYDIALRPQESGADTSSEHTLMDDIVVSDVEMFRAEDMTGKNWWVCCYLCGDERICWSVTARSNPLRIEWVTTEWPHGDFVYELGGEGDDRG